MKNLFLFLLFLLIFSCNKTRGDIVISKKDGKQYTHEQINEMLKQADRYYDQNLYVAAADLYKGVYDIQKPSDYVIYKLAYSYYSENKKFEALPYFMQIVDTNEENIDKGVMNTIIGDLFTDKKEINSAVLYYQKALLDLSKDDESVGLYNIGRAYLIGGDFEKSEKYLNEAFEKEVALHPIKDQSDNYILNSFLGEIKYLQALVYINRNIGTDNISIKDIDYIKQCLIVAAMCGQKQAIEMCNTYGFKYPKGFLQK